MGAESIRTYVAYPEKCFEENVGDLLHNLTDRVTEIEERQQDLAAEVDETDSLTPTEQVGYQPFPFSKGEQKKFQIAEVQDGANPGLRGVVEGIETFVDIHDPSNYTPGNVIMVEINDLDKNAAHAIPAGEMEV